MLMLVMDINKKVRDLLNSNKYFVSLKYKKKNPYWSNKKDPDGNYRDRLKNFSIEKKIFLKNNINLIKTIKSLKPKSVCDVGCGPGFLLSSLKIKNKVGIEIDHLAAKNASKFCKIYNIDLDKNFNINEKFDLVVCYHIIEHIQNPIVFIKNIKKIMKKDSFLIIGTPDFDSAMARHYKNKYRLLHDQTHISLFSLDSMSRLLRDMNFKIKKIDFPYFDTEYFNKKNLLKLLHNEKVSPPFYGSFMTFVVKKF